MAWEIIAIWLIVVVTLLWFRQDERRIQAEKLARRARYFAGAPAYRHETIVPAASHTLPAPQVRAHQSYLDLLQQTRRQKNSTQPGL